MIIYMTRTEYRLIHTIALECVMDDGTFNEAEWCRYLTKIFGCIPFQEYEVVIQDKIDGRGRICEEPEDW